MQPDMRGKRFEHFTVSKDGTRVRFGLKQSSAEPVLFDLSAERLSPAPEAPDDLNRADTQSLDIKDWVNHFHPKLHDVPIRLMDYEQARSVAIGPDQQRFVLGTDWRLRGYDKNGKPLWQPKEVPSIVWGVNITRDGRLIIAAYGDGTIRWHRLSDGQELLTLFVHAKDQRWVAWTPKGYYTASAGGEGLIGWHVNRGWADSADFFPAHRFRKQFYRPDIVERILADLDEDQAIKQANLAADRGRGEEDVKKQLPPVINILSPLEGSSSTSETLTVEYTLRSPSGLPITRVVAQVNGAVVASDNSGTGRLQPDDKLGRRISVKVPTSGEVTISLVAKAGDLSSEPATVTLRPGLQTERRLPILHALVIGVGDYRKESLNLPSAGKDARDFADRLAKQKGFAYADVKLFKGAPLLDADATQQAILDGVEWLKKHATGTDLALVYFSGHGTTAANGASYLLPFDYNLDRTSTFIDKGRLLNLLDEISAKVLLFLDACHSSDGLKRLNLKAALGPVALPESHIMAFAASLVGESARSDRDRSYFTRALIEAYDGRIPDRKTITQRDLDGWLERRVYRELSRGTQLPTRLMPDGQNARYFVDLTLAVVP